MGDLILDLQHVTPKERPRSWRETIRDNYLDLDIKFRSPFDPGGMIVQSRAGSITLGAISSVPQVHERNQTMDDDVDHLMGVMQFSGRMHLTQHGRDVTLTPGCFLMLDGAHSYHAEFPDEYQILVVKMPRLYFAGALTSKDSFVNSLFNESRGSMIVVDYFRQMARDFNRISIEQRARMSAHGVRLLADAVNAPSL